MRKKKLAILLSSALVLGLVVIGGWSTSLIDLPVSETQAPVTSTSSSSSEATTSEDEEPGSADPPTKRRAIPPEEPNFSSARELAISISYPMMDDGSLNPDALTGGGPADIGMVGKSYKEARLRAVGVASEADNLPLPRAGYSFADCGAYVATVIINTIDPSYPAILTNEQSDYLESHKSGWIKIGSTTRFAPGTYQPGDVLISDPKKGVMGHTMLWIGDHEGFENVVSDASYDPNADSTTARLPVLHTREFNKDGTDGYGRTYSVYRYVG